MPNSTNSKLTTVYFVSAATTATKILGLTSFESPETSVDRIDISSFDDIFKQYTSGQADVGEVSSEIIFDASDHATLVSFVNSQAVTQFMMLAPASATAAAVAPTVTASAFAAYNTVDNIKFSGYISKFKVSASKGDVWKASISIQGTGQPIYTAAP